jgi:hypothetical protein
MPRSKTSRVAGMRLPGWRLDGVNTSRSNLSKKLMWHRQNSEDRSVAEPDTRFGQPNDATAGARFNYSQEGLS